MNCWTKMTTGLLTIIMHLVNKLHLLVLETVRVTHLRYHGDLEGLLYK